MSQPPCPNWPANHRGVASDPDKHIEMVLIKRSLAVARRMRTYSEHCLQVRIERAECRPVLRPVFGEAVNGCRQQVPSVTSLIAREPIKISILPPAG